MTRRSTTSEFVKKAINKHGNRYDYSKSIYVKNSEKIIIKCKLHGEFKQTPNTHLSGSGCLDCSRESATYSTDTFKKKASEKHNGEYCYSLSNYIGATEKIEIICSHHGSFWQTASAHLFGAGCLKCFRIRSRITTADFVSRSKGIHGDKYCYIESKIERITDNVQIRCITHGVFTQNASDHARGRGCPSCAGTLRLTTEVFISKAMDTHGERYDYSMTECSENRQNVNIECRTHGKFSQIAANHLAGAGCPLCPHRMDQPTHIYLMSNNDGKVKIGYAIDPDRRVSELSRRTPFKPMILKVWGVPDTPSARRVEAGIHIELYDLNAGLSGFDGATEWFDTTPEYAIPIIEKIVSQHKTG